MTISIEKKMPEAFTSSRLLSCRQACEMLGISLATFWRLVGRKKDPLPSIKIGRGRRIQLDKLLFWIEKHEV